MDSAYPSTMSSTTSTTWSYKEQIPLRLLDDVLLDTYHCWPSHEFYTLAWKAIDITRATSDSDTDLENAADGVDPYILKEATTYADPDPRLLHSAKFLQYRAPGQL